MAEKSVSEVEGVVDESVAGNEEELGDPAPRPKRRMFTKEYRLRVLTEYEEATSEQEKSALLRREGIYETTIIEWAKGERAAQDTEVFADRESSRSVIAQNTGKFTKLENENARLRRELERTRAALEIMGKAQRLLELLSEGQDAIPAATKR